MSRSAKNCAVNGKKRMRALPRRRGLSKTSSLEFCRLHFSLWLRAVSRSKCFTFNSESCSDKPYLWNSKDKLILSLSDFAKRKAEFYLQVCIIFVCELLFQVTFDVQVGFYLEWRIEISWKLRHSARIVSWESFLVAKRTQDSA